MNSHFKSALSKVKAEEELILKTKAMLDSAKLQKAPVKLVTRRAIITRKALAMACSIVLVVGLSIWGYNIYNTPIAYLSLDINPSIELGLNAFNKVIVVTSYNSDGAKVLDGKQIVGNEIENAIDTLVKSASEHGFIADDGSTIISVTSESDDKQLGESIQKKAENGAHLALNSKHNVAAIYKENISFANHTAARDQGVSPGKLNLIRKVQKLDSSVTVEQFKNSKVTEIINAYIKKKSILKTISNVKPSPAPDAGTVSDPNAGVEPGNEETISDNNSDKDDNGGNGENGGTTTNTGNKDKPGWKPAHKNPNSGVVNGFVDPSNSIEVVVHQAKLNKQIRKNQKELNLHRPTQVPTPTPSVKSGAYNNGRPQIQKTPRIINHPKFGGGFGGGPAVGPSGGPIGGPVRGPVVGPR